MEGMKEQREEGRKEEGKKTGKHTPASPQTH